MKATTPSVSTWLNPPAVARQLGVSPAKILTLIASGELRASNLATTTSGRPRWRISPEALQDFLLGRQAQPVVRPVRRRRKAAHVTEFF